MIDYKWFLFGSMILFTTMEIITGEGSAPVSILIGWLVGLMTITQWEIKRKRSDAKEVENE